MASPVSIKHVGSLPEHGRIRTGVKSGRAMKAIETFRFTSPDKNAIEELAGLYGGNVQAWEDAKANPPKQWQVITTSDEIQVAIQPGSADSNYELWTAGGRQRSCDGEIVDVPTGDPDSNDTEEQACICDGQGVLECKPKTRVSVILPDIKFGGTWRYESSGLNALYTIPSMLEVVELLQSQSGMVPVTMALVQQKKVVRGQTKKFVVVQFRPSVTVNEMLTGAGTIQAQVGMGSTTTTPALAPSTTAGSAEQATPSSPESTEASTKEATTVTSTPSTDPKDEDDDIVDAEIVEDGDAPTGVTKSEAMAYVKAHGGVMKKGTGGKWDVTT